MKLAIQMAVAAASLSLIAASGAKADVIINYTFGAGTYFDFAGGSSNAVTGSFTYDATTKSLSNVNYNRGGDVFTVGSVYGPGNINGPSPTELYFGDTTTSDYDAYQFQAPLANGGTDTIGSGTHPAIPINAGGTITSSFASAAPEPASWVLMMLGVGLIGIMMRSRPARALRMNRLGA